MRRPRPFAVERRALRAPFHRPAGVEMAREHGTGAGEARMRAAVDSEGDGSVAADVGRILRGRTDFPRILWSEVM